MGRYFVVVVVVVIVVITPLLTRDGGMARMTIQVDGVNLIEIKAKGRWHPISNQSFMTGNNNNNNNNNKIPPHLF